MSLLTIVQALAKNVGMQVPLQVIGSPAREMIEAQQYANEAGDELARRVDWGQLRTSATLIGTGAAVQHSLPADFSRLNQGICVRAADGSTVRPLTRAEWSDLTPAAGVPRYFLLEGAAISLWPYLALSVAATAGYQSKAWVAGGGVGFMADTDTALVDEDLLTKGLIVRWRRQKGMAYQDEEAEYEAALQDLARFNDRSRL